MGTHANPRLILLFPPAETVRAQILGVHTRQESSSNDYL